MPPINRRSASDQPDPMLRLNTFGGLTLTRGTEDLTGAATQRRRLALLVLLAVAGPVGMSRDKLLAYLWPESDVERARHVLNQLLYASGSRSVTTCSWGGRHSASTRCSSPATSGRSSRPSPPRIS